MSVYTTPEDEWMINLAELFVNKDNGNWTIILTGRDKVACGLVGGNYGSQFIEEETDL